MLATHGFLLLPGPQVPVGVGTCPEPQRQEAAGMSSEARWEGRIQGPPGG